MKKILIFCAFCMTCLGGAGAAVRDGNATMRTKSGTATQQRVSTTVKSDRASSAARTAVLTPATASRTDTARAASPRTVTVRTGTVTSPRAATQSRAAVTTRADASAARNATPIISRAAQSATTGAAAQTRTGAEYENCKTAYFTCMDQFCQLKNEDYRRCSCSGRVAELAEVRGVMQQAGQQLTVFTENLDVVGMTAAQATAMRTASEGENALTSDTSASKALLQAIMNSIRGEDTTVGGKYSDLNSINLSFDTTNAFGISDSGQVIATYDGVNLYNAVYPQCRQAVRNDCTDAQLQRAITAYLMAIEQDCNTVQTAIEEKQKQMKSAVREGSAMLDLARVENRQKHNSDDIATCLNNVESAVLSEEVCGAGYRKCLDNGEFIDISTGAPIAGVVKFYQLGELLTFSDDVDASKQQLSKITNNRTFVQNFEKRVKKFAQPALDKCTEQADVVWAEYLDKAMLDIYYAQRSKVSEIKQGCFDFVSACYMNGDTALTAAMKELTGDSGVVLQPAKVALSTQMCRDYVDSCNNMFDGDIIKDYIANRQDTDTLTACRAVVKQCFDKFGGTGYENFYYPYSGLFTTGNAPDWFTLYELSPNGDIDLGVTDVNGKSIKGTYKSECAKQVSKIDACSDPKVIEQAFGGFDVMKTLRGKRISPEDIVYYYGGDAESTTKKYGKLSNIYNRLDQNLSGKLDTEEIKLTTDTSGYALTLAQRELRPTGVATEIYNQIVDILSTQCINLQGRFVEFQFIKPGMYDETNLCIATFADSEYDAPGITPKSRYSLINIFGIGTNENMCPRDYNLGVDTQSWGACLCWENGARRSKWGTSAKCVAALPVTQEDVNDANCTAEYTRPSDPKQITEKDTGKWCTQTTLSSSKQVCPLNGKVDNNGNCLNSDGNQLINLPEAITK